MLQKINDEVLTPALRLLPASWDSKEARVMLLAIGLQESRFTHRFQVVQGKPGAKGPARGLDICGKIKRPIHALKRTMGLTKNQPISEVRPMADANSILLLESKILSKSRVYKSACPGCGVERWNDKRRIGVNCPSCAAEKRKTHGLCGNPAYKLLLNIRSRCEQSSASGYRYYGGRGIYVCDEWKSNPAAFVSWAEENGYAKGLEIDRKDTDGPYSPENCQFINHQLNSQKRGNQQCDLESARKVKAALALGESVKRAALAACVPYMVAWHIKNNNTWRNA